MEKIRWGIVGPGIIANRFAEAVKNVDCAELAAVASRDGSRAAAFAEKYGIPNVFDSYEDMASSDVIDAVYIATPHNFHAPCAELFLNAKKHVLCEKPMTVNARQTERIITCAKENGVFLMEAMWTRFLPTVLEAERLVKEGIIGEVLGVEADFCYHSEPNPNHRIFLDTLAGGGLLDVGVYCLHFVSLFLGNEPTGISAMAKIEGGVDIHTAATMKYKGGAIATVSSAIGLRKPPDAYIYGTKGYVRLPRFYGGKEIFLVTEESTEHKTLEYIGNGFEEEIIEACRCIAEGKRESDVMPLCDSLAMMKQMDEIRRQISLTYPPEVEK